MKEINVQKNYGILAPADIEAEEIIKAMPHGKVMRLQYSFPRNYENHKRFFVFLKTTFDMQEHFSNIHHYRKWMIMKAGHYQIIKAPNGYEIFDTDSISFDKMDEATFRQLFSDCIDVFVETWGDSITREALEQVVGFS